VNAAPLEAVAADADAVAQRCGRAGDQIEEAVRRVHDDGAGRIIRAVKHRVTPQLGVEIGIPGGVIDAGIGLCIVGAGIGRIARRRAGPSR